MNFTADESLAHELDRADPLARFRERFFVPAGKIYMDGNSLGLSSRDGEECLGRVVEEWKRSAIQAWWDVEWPWIHYAERLGEEISPLIGAKSTEVVCTGATTINLHSLVSTFFCPRDGRDRILTDDLTFPSDLYALQSQVRLHGLDPATHLQLVPTQKGRYLDETKIIEKMGGDVALAIFPTVLYRSGQLLDVERLTRAARERGITIGLDCSHSVGAMQHHFDDWGVDFAFWCSYKYLNGGPGCPGFLYVNEKHFGRAPALAGWFGYKKDKQFDMLTEFEHERGAGGWQISSPAILGMAPIEGALRITKEAGIDAIREKSLTMTSYLMYLIDELLAGYGFEIGTPREPERRGGHVALEHPTKANRVFEALIARGVVGDLRPPNVIRIAPIALYNTYHEIWQVVQHVKAIAGSG